MSTTDRYLKTVRIRNFQSHRDTEVHLHPGINLVVGSSDVGKSAFMRAVNLVMHNEVPNREFVTYGADNATVILEFSDGTIVERVKGSTKNAYHLVLPDGSAKSFDKIGVNNMPEEVFKALGRPPSDKYHGPVAYADQHSRLFLVSLSPTELPRAISELTGLDDYEEAAMSLAKRARQYDRQIREAKDRVAGYEAELAQFANLEEDLQQYEALQQALEDANGLLGTINLGESLLEDYNEVRAQGRSAKKELDSARQVLTIGPGVTECRKIADQITEAEDILQSFHETSDEEALLVSSGKQAQAVLKLSVARTLEECAEILNKLTVCEEILQMYTSVNNEGKATKLKLSEAEDAMVSCREHRDQLMEQLQSLDMVCPSCGQLVGGAA
ncbi:MAG: AAA family ATPase [Armatimonadetes bacterium]|nr:AAA family ATPase [Armatimonadota bacterium]